MVWGHRGWAERLPSLPLLVGLVATAPHTQQRGLGQDCLFLTSYFPSLFPPHARVLLSWGQCRLRDVNF